MAREPVRVDSPPPARYHGLTMTGWHRLSRRELLKRTAVLGAASTVPLRVTVAARQAPPDSFVTLTVSEGRTLEAVVARLIPTDENGPGATEARAAYYIDRALGGALASSRETYAAGLAATDAYARVTEGAGFATLAPADQDRILGEMEEGVATGFEPSSRSFFSLVRTHTIQGTFCDPHYGGNADFVGWDLIGYPGLRLVVSEDDQRLEAPRARHRSAYGFGRFTTPEEREVSERSEDDRGR